MSIQQNRLPQRLQRTGIWYLVLGVWLLLRRHSPYPSDDKLAAKYQVPNTFIPLCPLWLSSLAER
jgi:hypothetical protein